jgi:hypothetical protein
MNHVRRVSRAVLLAIHWLLFASGPLCADSLVANGDFKTWTGGHPDRWDVQIGARNGAEEPKSEMTVEDLSQVGRWQKQRLDFRVPGKAVEAQLMIFLSKSGTLMVKNVGVVEAASERSFRGVD